MKCAISAEFLPTLRLPPLPSWEEHRRGRWIWLALVLAIVVWGFTDVRRRARIDPQDSAAHKTDFTVYTEAGAAFFDGRNPYEVANPRGWHYLYPPLFALVVAPLSAIGSQTQAVVWYFLSVAAAFGIWRECRRIWRFLPSTSFQVASPPRWLAWLAGAAVALPALNCLQRGQVGIVLVYLLMLGLRLTLVHQNTRMAFLGGIVLALPVTIKLTPLLPVLTLAFVFVAVAWRTRHCYAAAVADGLARGPVHRALACVAGQCAGGLLFVFVVPALLIGHESNVAHLRTWFARVASNDNVGIDNDFNARSMRNQSLGNAVHRLGNRVAYAAGWGPDDRLADNLDNARLALPMDTPAISRVLRGAALALAVLLATACVRVARRNDTPGIVAIFGLACAATLCVSPISWGHHYVLWLPALLFVPYWLWNNGRRAWAIGMVETALVLVAAHYILLNHAGRIGLLGIGTTMWCVAGLVSVGWPRERSEAVSVAITSAEFTPGSTKSLRRAA